MASTATEPYSSASIESLKSYYITSGYAVDQYMRKSLAAVKTQKDKTIVKSIIQLFYQPWLESITNKFQKQVEADAAVFTSQIADVETESFVLFVDAFRYELAQEFSERLAKYKLNVSMQKQAGPPFHL